MPPACTRAVGWQRWPSGGEQSSSPEPGEVPGAEEVIAIAPGKDKLGWFSALPKVRAVARDVAQRFEPTLVHGHYVTSYGMWAAACGLRVPKVLTAWGLTFWSPLAKAA